MRRHIAWVLLVGVPATQATEVAVTPPDFVADCKIPGRVSVASDRQTRI
jgi:hypothetical protein